MINEKQLKKQLKFRNKKRSAILITIGNKAKASKLYIKKLRFEKALKVIEKYWEAGPSLVYMIYSGIGNDWLEGYSERPV